MKEFLRTLMQGLSVLLFGTVVFVLFVLLFFFAVVYTRLILIMFFILGFGYVLGVDIKERQERAKRREKMLQ